MELIRGIWLTNMDPAGAQSRLLKVGEGLQGKSEFIRFSLVEPLPDHVKQSHKEPVFLCVLCVLERNSRCFSREQAGEMPGFSLNHAKRDCLYLSVISVFCLCGSVAIASICHPVSSIQHRFFYVDKTKRENIIIRISRE